MEHSAYKEQLSALLDGELRGAAREALLAHMETCADCRAYFAELTALRAALGDLEEYDAPEDFAAGVLARMRPEDTAGRIRAGDAAAFSGTNSGAAKTVKHRAARRGFAALAACAAVILLAVHALPNALRMGGGEQSAADSASNIVSASPASAPAAPAGGAAAPAEAAPDADPGYPYSYAGGGELGGYTAGATLESAREEIGAEDAKRPPAPANDGVSNGAGDAGRYAAQDADEPASIANDGEAPMAPLSRPEVWGEEFPVLTLSGEGAENWLAENGWQGESGAWYADAAALRALPETLTVVYSELSGDYDGTVLVWVAEPEEAEP